MILVDSSVWIDASRERESAPTPHVQLLRRALLQDRVAIAPLIAQEVLQGFRHDADYTRWHDALIGLPRVGIEEPMRDAFTAATLYRGCRAVGKIPRNHADCLIAATAINENLPLLSRDNDFEAIQLIEPMLILIRFA